MATLGAGDVFGEMSLLTGEPRSASAYAEDGLVLCAVSKAALLPILSANPAVAETFGLGGFSALTHGDGPARSPLATNRIVTYYGSPRAPQMGILGQHAPEDVADLLAERAMRFREAVLAWWQLGRVYQTRLSRAIRRCRRHGAAL